MLFLNADSAIKNPQPSQTQRSGVIFTIPAEICAFFGAAKIALVFNMLDRAVFPQHDLLTGHDRSEVTAFCCSLTSRVEVISGDLKDDFTVFMYHDAPHEPTGRRFSQAARVK